MKSMDKVAYEHIRSGGAGFLEMPRGLIAVWGKEAVQFLDGMITNDMKTLEEGQQMLAAFPNAKGRLLAVVRILRKGDKFLIETEEATRETVFQNLFRFTFAGDFFVEDLSQKYRICQVWNFERSSPASVLRFEGRGYTTWAIPHDEWRSFNYNLVDDGGFVQRSDRIYSEIDYETYELLRIESGIPKYGIDMDDTTIVPEIGLEEMISYNKGCYIGQEIIARIYFRGHVAKRLTGIMCESVLQPGDEILTADGKNAGRVTSTAFSPKLDKAIALAFVRYDYLAEGTELIANDTSVKVIDLPFVKK